MNHIKLEKIQKKKCMNNENGNCGQDMCLIIIIH